MTKIILSADIKQEEPLIQEAQMQWLEDVGKVSRTGRWLWH